MLDMVSYFTSFNIINDGKTIDDIISFFVE